MKKNIRNERDERSLEEDQLRNDTTNEAIREANGDADMDLNNLKDDVNDTFDRTSGDRSRVYGDTDETQGMSYTPNDTSAVRSGGITDMDDQTASGAGLNTGVRKGSGSHLNTKKGLTGSDFDGQNATS